MPTFFKTNSKRIFELFMPKMQHPYDRSPLTKNLCNDVFKQQTYMVVQPDRQQQLETGIFADRVTYDAELQPKGNDYSSEFDPRYTGLWPYKAGQIAFMSNGEFHKAVFEDYYQNSDWYCKNFLYQSEYDIMSIIKRQLHFISGNWREINYYHSQPDKIATC